MVTVYDVAQYILEKTGQIAAIKLEILVYYADTSISQNDDKQVSTQTWVP